MNCKPSRAGTQTSLCYNSRAPEQCLAVSTPNVLDGLANEGSNPPCLFLEVYPDHPSLLASAAAGRQNTPSPPLHEATRNQVWCLGLFLSLQHVNQKTFVKETSQGSSWLFLAKVLGPTAATIPDH